MFAGIEAKNFKAFGPKGVDIELGRLTILLGQNNSGKTSALEAVGLLAQTAKQNAPAFNWLGPWVDFGPLGKSAWLRSDDTREIEIGVRYAADELSEKWLLRNLPDQRLGIGGFGYRVAHRGSTNEWRHELLIDGHVQARNELKVVASSFRGVSFDSLLTLRDRPTTLYSPNASSSSILDPGLFAGRRKDAAIPNDAGTDDMMALASAVTLYLKDALRERVFLVGADRGPKDEKPDGSPADVVSVGRRGQHTLSLLSVLLARPEYAEKASRIQHWAEVFGLSGLRGGWTGEEVLRAGYIDDKNRAPLNLQAAGFGSQQILPIIVQLFSAPPGSLVMIEEPEISLHPEAQLHLVEMFSDAIALGKQVVLTTHSQTLLLALSAAANTLSTSEVLVYHMTRDDDGAAARRLELDSNWSLRGWVPSFSRVEHELLGKWMANVHDDIAKE
jgi:energy-coupling factor transporter ATP-binding protein EcfA2